MRVIIDIGRTLAKAVVAGVGVELARLASGHLRHRFGVKDDDEKPAETKKKPDTQADRLERDLEEVKRENAELRREIEALKAQRGG